MSSDSSLISYGHLPFMRQSACTSSARLEAKRSNSLSSLLKWKKKDLPQDDSGLKGFTREVCYVKNSEGKYEPIIMTYEFTDDYYSYSRNKSKTKNRIVFDEPTLTINRE